MNIKQAKEQIKNAMTAYFTKDAFGNYVIPIEKQRPVLLMGAPGIGKTSIMEQIAAELGVGLVSYSMTHHTRQSALGLPFITHKLYGGKQYDVSEYTMSEIIASVYDMMEETGVQEGILFLDEINCVSETLAPPMLQFLQYKVFGRHRVPDGWIVVTAGNPPEYNKSVRELDIVTWDRLKRIDVEPDLETWREYAWKKGVHASVLTYLAAKQDDFYVVESAVGGKLFVTARGWDDLSEMIKLYEQHNLPVDERLIGQYLQHPRIAKDFAIYYDLYRKYQSDYRIAEILDGQAPDEVKNRARMAGFDERLALLGLLLSAITAHLRMSVVEEDRLSALQQALREVKQAILERGAEPVAALDQQIAARHDKLDRGARSGALSREAQDDLRQQIVELQAYRDLLLQEQPEDAPAAFGLIQVRFGRQVAAFEAGAAKTGERLSNLFRFVEAVFGEGQEMLILVTELTAGYYSARFISRHGCAEYFAHNRELLFYERQKELIAQLSDLDIDA